MTSRAPENPLSGRRTSRLRAEERRRDAEKLRAGPPTSDPPQPLTTETDHSSRRHASGALPERRASLIPEIAKLLPETLRSETRARQLLSRLCWKVPQADYLSNEQVLQAVAAALKDAGSSLPKLEEAFHGHAVRARQKPRQPGGPTVSSPRKRMDTPSKVTSPVIARGIAEDGTLILRRRSRRTTWSVPPIQKADSPVIVRQITGQETCRCPHCGQSVARKRLGKHIARVHPGVDPNSR